jgi:hypothetical protein
VYVVAGTPDSPDILKHLELTSRLSTMTIPALKPDILRRVIEFALESCVVIGDDPATQLEKQGCLANLMSVSKVGPLLSYG